MAKSSGTISARPNVFKDEAFDVQFVRALEYAVYGGASTGECFLAARAIKNGDFESWRLGWSEIAKKVEARANGALREGRVPSARGDFLRAYNYHRAAEFFVSPVDALKPQIYERSRVCFAQFARLSDPPFELVEIPYEGTTLPGYFLRPNDRMERRPTLILLGGGDASGEELYLISGGTAALRRGYNVLIFDGPGQRGVLHRDPSLVFRHDYEAVISPVVDIVLERGDVDPERLALYAISLGGYLGARAAAFEPRLGALALNSPMTSFYDFTVEGARGRLGGVLPLGALGASVMALARVSSLIRFAMDQYRWIFGGETFREILANIEPFQLDGVEEQISCPTLCMGSTGETEELRAQTLAFYHALRTEKALRIFIEEEGADAHCQLNNLPLSHSVLLDWLDGVFGHGGTG